MQHLCAPNLAEHPQCELKFISKPDQVEDFRIVCAKTCFKLLLYFKSKKCLFDS